VLPYSAAVAASALYYRIALILVSAIASGVQLGYFSVSYRVIDVLTVIPTLLVSSAFPILARAAQDDHARFGYAVRKVFELSLIVGAWVAVSIAVAAPLGIAIIGGPRFKPAADVLAFQGIGLGAMFVNVVWGYSLLSLGLYRKILTINCSALILNMAIVASLAALDGARGAAIGTGLTEIVVACVQAWAFARSGHPLTDSIRVIPRVALATVLALTPLFFGGVDSIVRLVISSAIFMLVIAATKALPREVVALVPIDQIKQRLGLRSDNSKHQA
jgi:O-antigen/teichoic acid export membrane protein